MFQRLDKSALKVRTQVRTGAPHNGAVTCLCLKAKDEVMSSTANWPDLTAGAVDPHVCRAWALCTHTIFFLVMQNSRRSQEVGSALRDGCTTSQPATTEGTSQEVLCALFQCCCTVGQKSFTNVMGSGHFLYSVLIMATFTILK